MDYKEQKRLPAPLLIGATTLMLGGIAGFLLISSNRGTTPSAPESTSSSQDTTAAPGTADVSAGATPTTSPAPAAQDTSSATEQTITIVGTSYSFAPNTIKVKKGTRVKIIFRDDEGFHNLVVDGYQAATKTINGGETSEVQFVADKTGSFAYYCSVGSHRAKGMEGTLTVEE